jgi:hypothetical protein
MFKGGECHILNYIVFRDKFQVNEFFPVCELQAVEDQTG